MTKITAKELNALVAATVSTGQPVRLQVQKARHALEFSADQFEIVDASFEVVGYAKTHQAALDKVSKALTTAWDRQPSEPVAAAFKVAKA